MVCAALLFVAAGCLPTTFLTPNAPAPSQQHVVAGSVGRVASWLETALAEDGIVLVEKRQGNLVRLVGNTKSGKMFSLVLRQVPSRDSDVTSVAIQWAAEQDERFWRLVLQTLADMKPAPGSNSGSAVDDEK
jgi:hypothetical protein